MISVLCCGPCFDEAAIAEDGSLYPFLDHLLEYKDAKVYQLAQETIVLLLEFNPDSSNILGKYILDLSVLGQNPKTQNSPTQNSFGQNFWTQNPKTEFHI